MQELVDLDKRRRRDPIVGRKADEKMMELCEFLANPAVDGPAKAKAVETIKSLNLRPYWNYCREHLLNIGLEF